MRIISIIILISITISIFSGQKKYRLDCTPMLLRASLDSAISQIGIFELTDCNDGEVEKYLKLFGISEGQPYCAAGQYWCFYTASRDLELPKEKIPIIKSPLANKIFDDAKRKGERVRYIPARNDLIVWRKGSSIYGHIERIWKVYGRGNIITIAFNVYDARSGKEGVFFKKRNIYHPLGRMLIRGLIGFSSSQE